MSIRVRPTLTYVIIAGIVVCYLILNFALLKAPVPERDARAGIRTTPTPELVTPPKPTISTNTPVKSTSSHPNQAYIFVLTNDNMMTMLFALEASFKNVNTTRRRIALCTPGVSAQARDTMKKLNIETRDITQPQSAKFNTEISRWKDTLSKFAIFQMTDIDKFVYLDLDIIVFSNMDYLFDLPTTSLIHGMVDGTECHGGPLGMNAGLLVSSPNQTLYTELFKLLDESDTKEITKKGDQSMLNTYFDRHGMGRLLPESDYAFVWRCICVQNKDIPWFDVTKVKAIHFTGWWLKPDVLLRTGKGTWTPDCGQQYYARWIAMYREGMAWWTGKYPNEKPRLGPEMQGNV